MSPRLIQLKSRPICNPRVQLLILRFFHLSALTSCFLKNDKSHFLVFWVFILFLSRTWAYIITSARHFVHDTMLRFTLSAASAFLFFARLSFAAAVVIVVSLVFSQTQRNISINGAMLESSSSFSFSGLPFFLFRHHCYFCCFSCVLVNRRQLS